MEFFDEIINGRKQKKNVVEKLYEVPRKEPPEVRPRFRDPAPNVYNQADLLFLPNDKGFKYALVVVDNCTKICDAVPLKTKSANEVLNAFITIYSRGILEMPKYRIEVDDGTEFKNVVAKYFKENGVQVRVARPDRHKQQAIVERRNQLIGKYIHMIQAQKERITAMKSTAWVKDLHHLINALNRKTVKNRENVKAAPVEYVPLHKGDEIKILKVGTRVRIKLDAPIDPVTEKKLHGKFRSSDIRYHPSIKTIANVILRPDFPVMYEVEGEKVMFTAYELQVVDPKEEEPDVQKLGYKKAPKKVQKA